MSSESTKESVKVNTENTAEQVENVLVAKNVSDEVFPDDIEQVQPNIPQVDGASEKLDILYAFESEFAEEDVIYTLKEVLTEEIDLELIARVKVGDIRSAEYAYSVRVSPLSDDWLWPEMNKIQIDVLRNLRKGSPRCC